MKGYHGHVLCMFPLIDSKIALHAAQKEHHHGKNRDRRCWNSMGR